MDYAQLLGMTGGNQQGAGIMQNALGGGNVGAQLLGTTPAQLPGAGFQGFAPTSTVPDLLAKYRAQAAAAPPVQPPQPLAPPSAPAPAPVQAPIQPTQPDPRGMLPASMNPAVLKAHKQAQSSAYQFDPTGTMWMGTPGMGSVIYPYGGGPGANDG